MSFEFYTVYMYICIGLLIFVSFLEQEFLSLMHTGLNCISKVFTEK